MHKYTSENISEDITNMEVIHGGSTSNHFPLVTDLKLNDIPLNEQVASME